MTDVELYADPSCPFSWIAASWLRGIEGDVSLAIRPLPLAIVNEDEDVPEQYARTQRAALPLQRVQDVVRTEVGEDAGTAFYFAAASAFHGGGEGEFGDVSKHLADLGLDPALAAAAEDESIDERLRAQIEQAAMLVGEPCGSPVLAFPELGRALWGPVLRKAPTGAEAAELLSALQTVAGVDGFAQVKVALGGDLELPGA